MSTSREYLKLAELRLATGVTVEPLERGFSIHFPGLYSPFTQFAHDGPSCTAMYKEICAHIAVATAIRNLGACLVGFPVNPWPIYMDKTIQAWKDQN